MGKHHLLSFAIFMMLLTNAVNAQREFSSRLDWKYTGNGETFPQNGIPSDVYQGLAEVQTVFTLTEGYNDLVATFQVQKEREMTESEAAFL
ncbi:MAG TPA: hypothetical protein VJ939_02375, partial [Bacteroidales bacterium]|nr:hypothetical protein [Bacteroidales bacterium]